MSQPESSARSADPKVHHASQSEGTRLTLCGSSTGRTTRPHEIVNCPDCRVILNHVRQNFREYTDWRLTRADKRSAAESMYRDLVLGEVND